MVVVFSRLIRQKSSGKKFQYRKWYEQRLRKKIITKCLRRL